MYLDTNMVAVQRSRHAVRQSPSAGFSFDLPLLGTHAMAYAYWLALDRLSAGVKRHTGNR